MKKGRRLLPLSLCAALLLALAADAPPAPPSPAAVCTLPVYPALVAQREAKSVRLGVAAMSQYPELPNGCEITSLTQVLRFLGYDADKIELAENYLPCEDFTLETVSTAYYRGGKKRYRTLSVAYGPDPADAFAGDPTDLYGGYYCFAAPLAAAANAYLADQGADGAARDITGADADTLRAYLRAGQPVIVWCTLAMHEVFQSEVGWILPDGDAYYAYGNLHCVVLDGFDEDAGTFHIADPIYGVYSVDAALFLSRYEALGSNAVAVQQAKTGAAAAAALPDAFSQEAVAAAADVSAAVSEAAFADGDAVLAVSDRETADAVGDAGLTAEAEMAALPDEDAADADGVAETDAADELLPDGGVLPDDSGNAADALEGLLFGLTDAADGEDALLPDPCPPLAAPEPPG